MRWRLDLSSGAPASAAVLDPDQRRVVDHRHGSLLVLAGPGTGKTTTIVESICARLTDPEQPLAPDAVLALTFGRKAALELRDRVTARVGGGIVPTVATFHSFAYGLLRRTDDPDDYLEPPRLMSGAEEDVRIRTLLLGAVEDGAIDWPDDLMGALPTLGLANEVRAVLSRARDLGLEQEALQRIGLASGRPAWVAIGQLARQEQEVMALENVMDYSELMWRAVLRAREPQVQAMLHRQYRAVFVDEYQDTDPLQVALLRALVGPECAIVAVGDPDQAIYAFRGADLSGLEDFRTEFPAPGGDPAPVAVLRTCRRYGPVIRAGAAAVIARNRVVRGIPLEHVAAHRAPVCSATDPDDVDVRAYDDEGSLAAHVADAVRRAHVHDKVPWERMAVLVRTGLQIPRVQRALEGAGVPVVVAADEIPLRSEAAVAVLLLALRLAIDPDHASSADIEDLLTGPLCGLGSTDLRRVGRALRAAAHTPGEATAMAADLLRDVVVEWIQAEGPSAPLPPSDPSMAGVERAARLLRTVRAEVRGGSSPQEALWTLWTGGRTPHGWPERLRAEAFGGSRSAHHDLDAVMALFDAAERFTGRYPGFAGAQQFIDALAAQQIPAEQVSDRGVQEQAVRILTAHRAKGLEWDEVWVVGAQEGAWPDLRERGSTLRAAELGVDGLVPGTTAAQLLAEERRLFYVACTRARHRLHVAVVASPSDERDQPSRFVDDLLAGLREAGRPGQVVAVRGRPGYSLSLTGMVAMLRGAAQDPASPPAIRRAAVERLAVLAAERDDAGRLLVPLADPARWWGTRDVTEGVRPIRDPALPVRLSGSGLDGLVRCPLNWFLDRQVHAETPRGTATAFGSVVHAVADFVAKGAVPADLAAMDAEVERIWSALRFEAGWQSVVERSEARAALARFLAYHCGDDRELVSSERGVAARVEVPTPDGGTDTVELSGFVDRVEVDDEGRLVAIDLKNMRYAVREADIPEYGQLGVYQLILRESGLDATPGPHPVGGAALVQLRVPAAARAELPKVQFQEPLPEESPTWVEERLGQAAAIIRSEDFPAIAGAQCSYCPYASACPAQPLGEPVVP